MLDALLPGAQHLQNLHPLVVHFPVAFLPGAALLYIGAWLSRKESWAWVGLWLLVLGTIGAGAAVTTGLHGAEGVMVARSVREHLLDSHKRLMLMVLGLSAILTVWAALARPMPARGRLMFLVLLMVLFGVLAYGADFGGRMVYDYNAGGNACPQPIEFQH